VPVGCPIGITFSGMTSCGIFSTFLATSILSLYGYAAVQTAPKPKTFERVIAGFRHKLKMKKQRIVKEGFRTSRNDKEKIAERQKRLGFIYDG